MNDNNSDNFLEVKEFTNNLWKAFSHLRGSLPSSDFHVLLFLLTVYKDELIEVNESSKHFIKHDIINQLYNARPNLSEQYNIIIENYIAVIERMNDRNLGELISFFSYIDKFYLTKYFSKIFDSILTQISRSQGKSGGEFMQPLEISRLMCKLGDIKERAKIFNPFAGVASFGVHFNQKHEYYGQEINQKTWCLGAMRLMAYGKLAESNFLIEDSIEKWPNASQTFDLIISNPPFSVRLSPEQKYNWHTTHYFESSTLEQFLIQSGLQSLNLQGKLITILPVGFLFRGGQDQSLRKMLVDNNLIESIILLPAGLLYNTGIPIILLILSRSKKYSNNIRFVDAQNYYFKNQQQKVLDDERLLDTLKQDSDVQGEVKFVTINEILNNDYNLNVSRYFNEEIFPSNNEKLVQLGDVLELIRGQKTDLPLIGKLINVKDLKQDKLDFQLDISKIVNAELNKKGTHLLSESCLLITNRGKGLRPTLWEYSGEYIFTGQNVLSFKVREDIVDKAYLVNELHSEYVERQIDALRIGSFAVPTLRLEDLLKVVIKLPSIDVQRAKVQTIFELGDRIKRLENDRVAFEKGISVKEFNEFASLKHTLGRPRQNILDWADNLLDFLDKGGADFERINKAFATFYDVDIISALKEIKSDVNFMTHVLEKGENGLVLSEYEQKIISFSDLNSLINDLSNNGFNFRINKLLLRGENLQDRGILGNVVLLKTLIDNILTNAYKYAFHDNSAGNEVVIELLEIEDYLFIEIRNNGRSFPRNFNRDKFIAKYSTADTKNGSGLGGYDINRIATYFGNPEWLLILNEDPLFPVKFKFQFPIKTIK